MSTRQSRMSTILSVFLLVMLSFYIRSTYGFVIVESGQPNAVIVLCKTASDDDKSAAQELQTYLRKISGVDVPIQDMEESSIGANMIHIGAHKYIKKLGISLADIGPEGFKIKTVGNNLVLTGNEPHGTEYAVYTFLEKFLGVRWFWPGELGEVVPHSDTIKVDAIDFKDEPDYRMRYIGGWEMNPDGPTLWGLRNKRGGSFLIQAWGAHYKLVPPAKYAKDHPEYYSLVNGKRRTKYSHLCTTNPEVIRICIEYLRNFFDEHKNYDCHSLEENDSGAFCQCDKCRALDTGEKLVPFQSETPYAEPPLAPGNFGPGFVISDRMFTFANAVAEGLAETHPDKYVFMSSYSWHVPLPKKITKLHKNLILQTTSTCIGHWHEPRKQKDYAELAKWAQIADKIFIYEYYSNGLWPNMFRLIPTLIGESVPRYHQLGARYFYSQACRGYAINGLNYYVASKLLWDTSLDVKDILEDFYSKAFGAAREPMKKYFERLEQAWKDATINGDLYRSQRHQGIGRAYEQLLTIFKPGVLEQCSDYLDQAEKLADSDIIKKRIDFMRLGFRYNDLTMKAVRAVKRLEALGYPRFYRYRLTSPIKYPIDEAKAAAKYIDRQQTRQYLTEAIDAWRQRVEFVNSIKDLGAAQLHGHQKTFDPSRTISEFLDWHKTTFPES